MAAGTVVDAVATASTAAVDATSSATPVHTGFALVVDRIDYVIMVPLLYASVLFLLGGILWRIVTIMRAPAPSYRPLLYPASPRPVLAALGDVFGMTPVRKHRPVFWVLLMVFHAALLLLILGHLDILPTINLVPASSRHMLGAGGVGVAVTLPVAYFFLRRLRSPNREISVPADFVLLMLLLFLLLFGDLMSWGNSWSPNGFVMTKKDFSLYFQGLARFTFADPRAVLPGSHYHFAVIHVLLAEALFVVLPFSKVMHTFFAIPITLLKRR